MEEVALQAARFLHYVAVTFLFGITIFPIYAFDKRHYIFSPPLFARPLPWAIMGLITACLWLVLSAANMANSFGAIADLETWRAVFDIEFGRVWATRIIIATVIVAVCFLKPAPVGSAGFSVVVAVLSGMLLVTLSAVGHTQREQGMAGGLHMGMDALHLIAAGAWLGGLVGLMATLGEPYADYRATILMRFSGVGLLAVTTLLATGLVNSWFLVGTIDNLITSRYGQLLIGKLAVFLGMVAFAAANRFWLLPVMESMPNPEDRSATLHQLNRHIVSELGLGAVVLMVVSVLGTLQPAAG